MTEIVFEAHGTTYDNEAKLSSGWNDVPLSELGKRQARELGERYKDEHLDAIFCSDLKRSYETAELASTQRSVPIVRDARLRECNYGDLTGRPSEEVEPLKVHHITKPFPNGESYEETSERMKDFLKDLLRDYNEKRVMIIGHRATQYGLERWINHVPLSQLVAVPFKWQPGWRYTLLEEIG